MSHRTQDLTPLSGVRHAIRELRYHEPTRQSLAVLLILLFTLTASPTRLWVLVGTPLVVLGVFVRIYASGFILKNKELATHGPYALVRHPLYTGNILLLLGFSVASGRWWALPVVLLFFWFYYPTAIEYEDRKLRGIFDAEWDAWSAKTPALLPNLRDARRAFVGEWSFVKSTHRNGELVIAVYALVCMYFIAARVF